ncbi:MAG: hypothetical protein K5776_04550 [Lachnospiraceae bacterium]|nr:hypothetical protein [Lachnospiraceae bacterium]
MSEFEIKKFANKVAGLMYVSFAIWICIIVYQFFVGLLTLIIGYGVGTLAIMVYNLIGCIRYFKSISIIKTYSTKQDAANLVAYFERSIPMCWIFMFVNLLFGGFFGFIGNLYDLILSYYVKSKKGELLMPAQDPIVYDVEN